MVDAVADFAYSTVATAPSPATTGVSITLAAGGGSAFPVAPFTATVWPSAAAAQKSNAEIVRVTAKNGDVLTVQRAQDGTTARTIAVGWQIAQTITASLLRQIALTPTSTTALTRMYAGIARRDTNPAPIVTTGSSTSFGQGSTSDNRALFNRWVNTLQADYPLSTGTAQPTQQNYSAGATLANGIGHIRAGASGSNSGTYLDDTKAAGIGALNPVAVVHNIGSNDYAVNRLPSLVKSDVLSWANKIDAAVTNGFLPVHILVHGHRRTNVSNPTYSWNSYAAVFAELASEYPDRFVSVNLYDAYRKVGQDSIYQHPFMYNAVNGPNDNIHLTDAGHAFGADLLRSATREALPVNVLAAVSTDPANPTSPTDTTAPTVSTFTATPSSTQVALAWTGADNVAITRWLLKRDGVTVYDGSATSYTDTGRTNGTALNYTLVAYDAAGNVSTTANATATPSATAAPPVNSVAPVVSPSSATAGTTTLTSTSGTWSNSPTYAYQWRRNGVAISGATTNTYATVAGDATIEITCAVTATNVDGSATAVSNGVTPVAAGAGVPDYTTGMMAQYKGSSLTEADGAPVNAWSSSAGSAGVATMNQVVAAPLALAAGPNGKKAIRFAGGSTSTAPSLSVLGPVLTVPRECSYFYVIRRMGPMGRAIGAGQSESTRYHVLFDQYNNSGIVFAVGSVTSNAAEVMSYTGSILNEWMVIGVSARANGQTSRMRVGLTRGNVTANIVNTTDNYGITLGTSGARTGFGQFDLAELRVYNTPLSDADMQTVMAKLADEYALTS